MIDKTSIAYRCVGCAISIWSPIILKVRIILLWCPAIVTHPNFIQRRGTKIMRCPGTQHEIISRNQTDSFTTIIIIYCRRPICLSRCLVCVCICCWDVKFHRPQVKHKCSLAGMVILPIIGNKIFLEGERSRQWVTCTARIICIAQ